MAIQKQFITKNYKHEEKYFISFLIISFLFILPLFAFSQTWDQASNFIGDGRHHPITFSNENYGFVVSGSYLDDVYKYDKSNDTWSQLQNIPFTGRGYAYAVAINNKAYIGFGSTSNGVYPTDWWEYDMNNDIWSQKQIFQVMEDNILPWLLQTTKYIWDVVGMSNGNLGDWWEYDVSNRYMDTKSDIIGNNRHHPFYFGIGNYAYVGFGHGSIQDLEVTLHHLHIFTMTF